MISGLVLLASRAARPGAVRRVGPALGLAVGVAQAFALLPGISRSGATIVTGLFCGLERRTAGRFAFLLAAPALAGAGLHEAWQGLAAAPGSEATVGPGAGALAVGALAAAVTGTGCLLVLLRVVERGRLHWFAAYCLPAGAAMLALGLLA
jgi:undecaprenyl-diphosphatase